VGPAEEQEGVLALALAVQLYSLLPGRRQIERDDDGRTAVVYIGPQRPGPHLPLHCTPTDTAFHMHG
jgi:hypothetical protein